MWLFTLFVLSAICGFSEAMTDEEVKIEMTKVVMKCTKEHPVEMNELMSLQMLKTPTDKASKCLLACAYRKEGSMNDKGMIDVVHTIKRAEEIAGDDEKRLAKAKELAEMCNKVNDEKVSDGDKGCDRAALLFECIIKNGPKLGFKV